MERDFYKFGHGEKIAFDKAFPPEEIERFMNAGEDEPDPVEIFEALKTFDFPDTRPEARNIVIAHFSESRFAPQINMHDGPNGSVMIYRRNVVPLLRASQDIFVQIVDLFTDGVKKSLDRERSCAKNQEHDWEK